MKGKIRFSTYEGLSKRWRTIITKKYFRLLTRIGS